MFWRGMNDYDPSAHRQWKLKITPTTLDFYSRLAQVFDDAKSCLSFFSWYPVSKRKGYWMSLVVDFRSDAF